MSVASKLGTFPRVIRQDWTSDNMGSTNRCILQLPTGPICDLKLTFTHCTVGGAENSEWEAAPWCTIDGNPCHFDEAMGLLSGDMREPDIGIDMLGVLIEPHLVADHEAWVEFRSSVQAEADAEFQENRAFYISQRVGKA